MRNGICLIVLVLAVSGGCTHPSGPLSVDNPDPSVKIPAIKQAARTDDRSALPQLVRDLESDDAAVRFFAIEALRRIAHQDFGYRFYDDKMQRRDAVGQWRQWLEARERQSSVADAHE